MIKIRLPVWLVLSLLMLAVPAGADVDCATVGDDHPPCEDTDNNPCTIAVCSGGECKQDGSFADQMTMCPDADADKNPCTVARCDGGGNCLQTAPAPANTTTCPDTDNDECTTAACDGSGGCNQNQLLKTEGTPCTDTDGDPCSIAKCDDEGMCDQRFEGMPDGTTCLDTDGDECSKAGCDNGRCDQSFAAGSLPFNSPCPDTDENSCTIPSCNAAHVCNQSRSRAGDGVACTDHGVPGHCQGADCIAPAANLAAPTMSVVGMAYLTGMLLVLGLWQKRRRSVR